MMRMSAFIGLCFVGLLVHACAPDIDAVGCGSNADCLPSEDCLSGDCVARCVGDRDNDGYGEGCDLGADCDDDNADVFRSAFVAEDRDGDGYTREGDTLCLGATNPPGFVDNESEPFDCDDDDESVFIAGLFFTDADEDGVGVGAAQSLCTILDPPGLTSLAPTEDDCDDNDPERFRLQSLFADTDDDTFTSGGVVQVCTGEGLPNGFRLSASIEEDCDDLDAARAPGAQEVCDRIDNNCNDEIDEPTEDASTCPCARREQGQYRRCLFSGAKDDATYFCDRIPGHRLAQPKEASDNFVLDEIRTISFPIVGDIKFPIWIDLVRVADNYVWADGSPLTYDAFAVDQPDNQDLCVAFERSGWNDVSCDASNVFVCEAQERDLNQTCIDDDGDGYGEHCLLGRDCDDNDPSGQHLVFGYPDIDGDGHVVPRREYFCNDGVLPATHLRALIAGSNDCDDTSGAIFEECVIEKRVFANHEYHFIPTLRTFQAARQDCVALGGDLMSIGDSDEYFYMDAEARTITADIPHWFGLNDRDIENSFEWTDGSPVRLRFIGDQPSGEGDCVTFSTLGWDDTDCAQTHPYICEIPR